MSCLTTTGTSTAAAPLRGPRELPLPAKQISMAGAGEVAMPQRRLMAYAVYSPAPAYYYSPRVYAAPRG